MYHYFTVFKPLHEIVKYPLCRKDIVANHRKSQILQFYYISSKVDKQNLESTQNRNLELMFRFIKNKSQVVIFGPKPKVIQKYEVFCVF